MNFRTTAILLVVLAAALTVVFFANRKTGPDKAPPPDTRGRKIFDVKADGKGELVNGGQLADRLEKGQAKLVSSLRDKQLVKASTSDIRQVEIDHRGPKPGKLVLQKQGGDWKIAEPQQVPGDTNE